MADTPRQTADRLISELRTALGARVQSAVLYGSAARGEYIPGVSDVNVMVLLDDIDTSVLAKAAPIAGKWAHAGHTPPLIMEAQQWRRAADVFAIELADMREAHTPLFGDDFVQGAPLATADLRAQAERELRGKLLQLQTGLLMAAGTPASLGDLLKKALPSFTTYLRAAIRLSGSRVPGTTPEVIRTGSNLVGAPADAWLKVWDARTANQALKLSINDPIVEQYHTAAEQTAAFVDHLREGEK